MQQRHATCGTQYYNMQPVHDAILRHATCNMCNVAGGRGAERTHKRHADERCGSPCRARRRARTQRGRCCPCTQAPHRTARAVPEWAMPVHYEWVAAHAVLRVCCGLYREILVIRGASAVGSNALVTRPCGPCSGCKNEHSPQRHAVRRSSSDFPPLCPVEQTCAGCRHQ